MFGLPEERLVQHDKNREKIQKQIKEICVIAKEEADSSEARNSKEIREAYEETEERILSLIRVLNGKIEESEETVNRKDFCGRNTSILWNSRDLNSFMVFVGLLSFI